MKVLLLNAYYYPENIAFSHLERDITDALLRRGHEVCVVCPTPSRGLSKAEIKRYKRIKKDHFGGVAIQRFSAPAEKCNPLLRAVRYFWCNFREYAVGKRYKDADVIFAVSTPPTQGRIAGRLAKKLGIPFVYSVQDLFPDSMVSCCLTSKGSLLYRIGEKTAEKTYRSATNIIVLTPTMHDTLVHRGVAPEKLLTVSNWINTEAVRPVARDDNRLFDEFGLDKDRFYVVYAGNLGAAQGAGVILEAAALLRHQPEIQFVIFGSGAEFDKVLSETRSKQPDNVLLEPLLPPDRVSEVYSLGDVALIVGKTGVGKTAVPSKLWSIMACGTPVIASFDGDSELAGILEDAQAGVCVAPENPEALAQAIENAYHASKTATPVTSAAREYVLHHAAKNDCVGRYVRCIEDAVHSHGKSHRGNA